MLFVVLSAIFGLLFGSFLNVCIYRIPRDLSIVAPRSFCCECGHTIAWFDNIPLLSYILLQGRCRFCRERIGIRYFFVELTTAFLFAAIAIKFGQSLAVLKWMIFLSILIVLFWTDLEERILPDELTLGGTAAGLLLSAFVPIPGLWQSAPAYAPHWRWHSLLNSILSALIVAGSMGLLGYLYMRLRKREGLGWGDVKLTLLIAVFLGLADSLRALLIGSVGGAVLGLAFILLTRKNAKSYELPFGSFLCLGAAVIPFLQQR